MFKARIINLVRFPALVSMLLCAALVGRAGAEDEQKRLRVQRTLLGWWVHAKSALLRRCRTSLSLLKQRLSLESLAIISNAEAISAVYQVSVFLVFSPALIVVAE